MFGKEKQNKEDILIPVMYIIITREDAGDEIKHPCSFSKFHVDDNGRRHQDFVELKTEKPQKFDVFVLSKKTKKGEVYTSIINKGTKEYYQKLMYSLVNFWNLKSSLTSDGHFRTKSEEGYKLLDSDKSSKVDYYLDEKPILKPDDEALIRRVIGYDGALTMDELKRVKNIIEEANLSIQNRFEKARAIVQKLEEEKEEMFLRNCPEEAQRRERMKQNEINTTNYLNGLKKHAKEIKKTFEM